MLDTRPLFIPANPEGIDFPLLEIQSMLIDCFGEQNKDIEGRPWYFLNRAYGKAERRVRTVNDRNQFYPSFHVLGEYLSLFPDTHIGNFTWFDVEDPISTEQFNRFTYSRFQANVGLIFWYDYRTVFPDDWQGRTIENVKALFIRFFTDVRFPSLNKIEILNIEERTQNIYQGYTHNELDTQYLMHPYGAIRINLEIRWNEKCEPGLYEAFKGK